MLQTRSNFRNLGSGCSIGNANEKPPVSEKADTIIAGGSGRGGGSGGSGGGSIGGGGGGKANNIIEELKQIKQFLSGPDPDYESSVDAIGFDLQGDQIGYRNPLGAKRSPAQLSKFNENLIKIRRARRPHSNQCNSFRSIYQQQIENLMHDQGGQFLPVQANQLPAMEANAKIAEQKNPFYLLRGIDREKRQNLENLPEIVDHHRRKKSDKQSNFASFMKNLKFNPLKQIYEKVEAAERPEKENCEFPAVEKRKVRKYYQKLSLNQILQIQNSNLKEIDGSSVVLQPLQENSNVQDNHMFDDRNLQLIHKTTHAPQKSSQRGKSAPKDSKANFYLEEYLRIVNFQEASVISTDQVERKLRNDPILINHRLQE